MTIYYYAPANPRPSWGIGMIYYHVHLLKKNGIDAYVLHEKRPFAINWLDISVAVKYMDDKNFKVQQDDVLVVAEIEADKKAFEKLHCRKIVFVQNAFYIYEGLRSGADYKSLGFEAQFYYMPHLKKILQYLSDLPLYEIPPFIAPYYFDHLQEVKRKRSIILYPKFDNKEYEILRRILTEKLNLKKRGFIDKIFGGKDEWEIIELKDLSHKEVAKEMRKATFFVSINTTEAFNSAVPEAMASGCINFCFEGVGPADFLVDNVNAFVFPNDHIYQLAEKLVYMVTNFDTCENELNTMRENALKIAAGYTVDKVEKALLEYFA